MNRTDHLVTPDQSRMRKVLFILSELLDEDVEWMANNGDRLRYLVGREIIPYNSQPDSIWFVLDGTFSVLSGSGELIVELRSGEIIGEMSLRNSTISEALLAKSHQASLRFERLLKRMAS